MTCFGGNYHPRVQAPPRAPCIRQTQPRTAGQRQSWPVHFDLATPLWALCVELMRILFHPRSGDSGFVLPINCIGFPHAGLERRLLHLYKNL
jgi:hypothetical protein